MTGTDGTPAPSPSPHHDPDDLDAAPFGAAGIIAGLLLVVCVSALTLGVWSVGRTDGNGGTASGAASNVAVSLADFKIEPGGLTVASGGVLAVKNIGAVPHNLEVEGADLVTKDLNAGESDDLSLSGLAPGSYTVFCAIPGHREMGMETTLQITSGGGSSAAASPGEGSDSGTHEMTAEEMDELMAKAVKAFPAKTEGQGALPLAPKVLPDGTKRFDLTAKKVKWEVEPGKFVDALTYNGVVPGPTIHVNPGDKVEIALHNELTESTVVHWHGITVPNEMDGVPDVTQHPIKPGETFVYKFTAQNSPAVGMYHSHHNAAKQVSDGMLGPILIGELPIPVGTLSKTGYTVPEGIKISQEIPMVLNDAGTIGLTLNGKSFPATAPINTKKGDWILIHYMNEGVMVHPMHLHGPAQLVIAKDGFPLEQPYLADTVNVAPGERYSVLVNADRLGTWAFHCHILSHAERSDGMFGMVTLMTIEP